MIEGMNEVKGWIV